MFANPSHRLTSWAAGAVALVASAVTAHASKPTLGVEWEFAPVYSGVLAYDGTVDGGRIASPKDPALVSQQTVLCTVGRINAATQNIAPTEKIPLVGITHDLDWIPRSAPKGNVDDADYVEKARTIEVVTGPIDHDADKTWSDVALVVKTFYEALGAVCAEQAVDPRFDYSAFTKTKAICFAPAEAVAKKMNETLTGNLQVVLGTHKDGSAPAVTNCGDDYSHTPVQANLSLKNVGFFLQARKHPKQNLEKSRKLEPFYRADTIGLVDSNTQVNVALRLEHLGTKPEVSQLFSGAAVTAPTAYDIALVALRSSTHKAHVRGFFALYAYLLSAEAEALRSDTTGHHRKNLFNLYLKSPLGDVYDRIKKDIDPKDPLQISSDEKAVMYINANYCSVEGMIHPGTGEKGPLCEKLYRDIGPVFEGLEDMYTKPPFSIGGRLYQEIRLIETWNRRILGEEGNKNPLDVVKPIAPIGDGAATAVVLEMRFTDHAVNKAAHLARQSGGAWGLANPLMIKGYLLPFKE